jgi:hypothetical protein
MIAETMTVTVDTLREGDLILACPTQKYVNAMVCKVERKDKCAVVHFSDRSTTIRWNRDAEVRVVRYVKDEMEKREDARRYMVNSLRDDMKKNTMQRVLQRLQDGITHYNGGKRAEVISHWDLEEILKDQAFGKFWSRVAFTTDQYVVAGVDDDTALLASFYLYATERVYPSNPLSRSTSVMSNVYNDLDEYVIKYLSDRYLNGDRLGIEFPDVFTSAVVVAKEAAQLVNA